MRKLLIIIITICASFTVANAQDTYFQDTPVSVEREAEDLTISYNKQLSMNGEQALLFKKKIAEFLMRKNEVEVKFSKREKLDRLFNLSQEETAEMANILTRTQLKLYRKIKPNLQPISTVKE